MLWSYVATSVFILQVVSVYPEVEVAYVTMAIHVCGNCMFQMFQLFSEVCCKCFISMLHMLQWLYTYVASVCFHLLHVASVFISRHGKRAQTEVVPCTSGR